LSVEKAREQVNIVRQRVSAPVNMNFFCHKPVDADPKREAQWKQRLAPCYKELDSIRQRDQRRQPRSVRCRDVRTGRGTEAGNRELPFRPADEALLKRVKAAGCIVISSATIVKEAIWLEVNGADAIIAQGAEAGGHRACS